MNSAMKIPHLLMLLNCFLSSVANPSIDRILTENHVTQDPTNKETFIPVPVNNDKFSKLSNSHKSHDDEKRSNNDNNSSSNNNSNSSSSSGNNINRDNSNVDVRQTVEKKSFKNTKPSGKVQNLDIENISPPKQQQQLHSGNKNNYKLLLDDPFQHDYETGRNPFRYAPTEEDYISKVLRNELDLIQPGSDEEVDYNNNYNHNKRYNDNKNNNYYSQSKRYSNFNDDDDDDNVDYSDYDQLDDDEYRAKYLKGRINSLAHLLGSKVGPEAHKRLSDRRNLLDDYLGRVVIPRSSEHLIKSYYDDDQIEDDDVMDSYDLARVMLKRSDTSYLDNYIDNAVRSGLLNPKLAENYKLNVMREYERMISNHDDNENNDDDNDDDDVINDDVSDEVGDEDALPEISEDDRERIGAEFSEHFPAAIPEFKVGFESRMFDPLHHKVEKKFQFSGGHSFNDRQQELEEFAAILKQVHLENELENMARKHANQLIN